MAAAPTLSLFSAPPSAIFNFAPTSPLNEMPPKPASKAKPVSSASAKPRSTRSQGKPKSVAAPPSKPRSKATPKKVVLKSPEPESEPAGDDEAESEEGVDEVPAKEPARASSTATDPVRSPSPPEISDDLLCYFNAPSVKPLVPYLKRAEAIDEDEILEVELAIRNALPVLRLLHRESQKERQPEEFRRFYHQYTQLLRSLGKVPAAWAAVTLPVENIDDEPEYPEKGFKLPTALPPMLRRAREPPVDESNLVDANELFPKPRPSAFGKKGKSIKVDQQPEAAGPSSSTPSKRNLRSSKKAGEEQTVLRVRFSTGRGICGVQKFIYHTRTCDTRDRDTAGLPVPVSHPKRKRGSGKGKKKASPEPLSDVEMSDVEDRGAPSSDDDDEGVQPPKKTRKNAKGKKVRVGRTKVKDMDTRAFGKEVGELAEKLAARKLKNRKAKDKSLQLTIDTGAEAPFVTIVRQPNTGSRIIYSALAPKNILRGMPEEHDDREIPPISMEEVQELDVEAAVAPKFRCANCCLAGEECRVVGFGAVCAFCQSHGFTRCSDHMSAEEILLAHRRLSSLYAISSDLYEVSFREALAAQRRAIELQELARKASLEALDRYAHLFTLSHSMIDALGPDIFLERFASKEEPDLIVDHFKSQVAAYNLLRYGSDTEMVIVPDEHEPAVEWQRFTNGKFFKGAHNVPIFSNLREEFVVDCETTSSPEPQKQGSSKKGKGKAKATS
ncbi:hypothetical protein C8R47DRAFT_1225852 [Mycena vitilis]|nr:hypothetical protein C8R47DRAFT_1225852 [Mycena vitilis]